MAEAISDTGPILHLHEIGSLQALRCFGELEIPDLVARELESFDLSADLVADAVGGRFQVTEVAKSDWQVLISLEGARLQPADAQVLALARTAEFRTPVLTDDLEVRRVVETENGLAVGSIGILVRNYHLGHLARFELEERVAQLLTESTLHMSSPFRRYVRRLIRDIE